MADEVQIDSLSVAIEQSAKDSSDSLERLAKNLGELKTAVTGLRLTSTVNGLHGIADATSKLDRDKVAALGDLGDALAKIAGAGKISSSFARQITGIGAAIDGLGDIDTAKLTGLADALSPLASLDRAKLTSYINQLKQLPEVAEALNGMDMDGFAASIRRAADAMKPLADEMEKVSNGFSALPTKIQRIIRENDRLTSSTKKGATGWRAFWKEVWGGGGRSHSVVRELMGLTSATAIFFKAKDTLVSANVSINDYIENLNLFGVAMGEYAEEAYDYATVVESVLGVNPSDWTRMQAVIMDMAKSFGVASDTAYTMSKALTQLTYDYASFYNLSTDEAANKVRSAIAGEIEPVRALGKDLSVAKLQLTATELGINGTVDAMTQADKAMLRTITLLRQSESAQGDLARTLDEPANQMRILAAQTEMLSTALGELFLPILQEVLPYAISTVKVLRMVTEEFARLAGFELPEFKSASATEEVEALGGALEEAADEAERLFQLSFDELNILGSAATSGSGIDNTDKLTAELERLAAIQDAAFMKDVEDSVAGITQDMVDWLTKGQGIETWVGNIYEKFEYVNEIVGGIAKALGWWDGDLETTGEVLDTGVNGFERILKAAIKIKGLKILNNLSKALTGDNLLASALKKIFGNTEKVADAFDNKNKKLEKQTEDTVADTAAVTDLAGELAGATKKTDDASDALNIMGGIALGLAGTLTDNPLTPVVDSSDATAAFEELVEQAGVSMEQVAAIVDDQGKTVAEKEAAAADLFVQAGKDGWDELVRLATEYGVTIVDNTAATGEALVEKAKESGSEYTETVQTTFTDAEKTALDSLTRTETGVTGALDSIDQETVDFANGVTGTVNTLGENLYNGLTTPVEEAAQEIGGTFQAIADEYKELQDYLRTDATSSFKSQLASRNTVAGYTAKSGTYIKSTYDPVGAGYGNSWKNSFQNDKAMQDAAIKAAADETAKDFFKYAQTVDKNPELTSKLTTGTNVFTNIIDESLDLFKWLLGGASMSFGIPAFASGGIVEDGLFMANSTELVGRFANGRTAVANNEQITAGISDGVRDANHELIGVIYAAAQQIVQAVKEGSVIYFDTDRVTKKVTDAQSRSSRMHGA